MIKINTQEGVDLLNVKFVVIYAKWDSVECRKANNMNTLNKAQYVWNMDFQ